MIRLGRMSRRVASSGVMRCRVLDDIMSAEREFRNIFTTRAGCHTPMYSLLSGAPGTVIDRSGVKDGVSHLSNQIFPSAISIDGDAEKNNCSALWYLLSRGGRPELLGLFRGPHSQKIVGWGSQITGVPAIIKDHASVIISEETPMSKKDWEKLGRRDRHR
jgi:hypothetical protein